MTHHTRTRADRDAGYTLVEVVVTLGLMALMMTIAVSGWNSWAASRQHSGTAQEITVYLRQAQQRAVTEGRATCVQFDTTRSEWSIFRGSCDATDKILVQGPVATQSPRVRIASATFTGSATAQPGVTFDARGTAWPGAVHIVRSGSDKTYVVTVEGLTGRVALS
ncbi:type II secretion system protein GspH [Nocardioides gansuensis]|uniref:Type II secretion system protein GspH n=1 Tax=Nocardioides gansuensis TaxID=2138300 RepID=A0A2T8F750_9ACTN|nr:GspH/FimT family pseudopilin [Nocardioides gansuensis]PVG81541.1 type II secretion system protein GspH [Nocardioides gansuensis]